MHLDLRSKSALVQVQSSTDHCSHVARIFDIREENADLSLHIKVQEMLGVQEGVCMQVPFELLYDTRGLRLFEEITYLDDYYLTGAELEILREIADQLAANLQEGSVIMELGSGYNSRTSIKSTLEQEADVHLPF